MMMRLLAVLLSFFPILVFADSPSGGSALSFAPPASDYSVVFLGNLFGVVDGVLHGTGSQMMGTIFSVFNAAVLALGGIIIMYTLIVSTMNTAHEGQMLGQKWSSIWIPLRSTLGLALLIPKASGYCLMQIFVMWIVVQGVGAADKVWEAALGYLNRGGSIIQAQSNNTQNLLSIVNGTQNAIPKGAYTILAGQVCMLGIQKQLEKQRKSDTSPTGRCNSSSSNFVNPLCSGVVPDFLATVNFVTAEQDAQNAKSSGTRSLQMPNFTTNDYPQYAKLNGKCGTVKWNALDSLTEGTSTANGGASATPGASTTTGSTTTYANNITLTASQVQTAQMTRAIAIQQMYVDLSAVAQVMIGNNPAMNTSSATPPKTIFSNVALQQFGVPYNTAGGACTIYNQKCTTWGPDSQSSITFNSDGTTTSSSGGALFNGTEFMGAVLDYNGIMKATLSLINSIKSDAAAGDKRAFINTANQQGWMMAGAYYYNLIKINGSSMDWGSLTDTNSGLEGSLPLVMTDIVDNTLLRQLLQDESAILNIQAIIDGKGVVQNLVPIASQNQSSLPNGLATPALADNPNRSSDNGLASSTVYGFINNSLMIQLAGQPGIQSMQFANIMTFTPDTKMYYLQQQNFSCGYVKTFVFSFCLGSLLGNIFYNGIIYVIYNALVFFFQQIIQQVIMAFIMIPIQGMSQIFKDGLETISRPGTDPIQALAQMGVMYINFSGNLWMGLMAMAITSSLIPMFGIFIFALFVFVLPLLFSWIGIMVAVGFTTAYYIPILPYMIFTFGSIAWLISVIEAMVAAPIVALGVTHPEGHDAFGKGEAAIMLLMNVFLRPAMMIIGYISAIALSYVSVWILNAGFDNAIMYIQGGNSRGIGKAGMDLNLWGGDASFTGTTNSSYSTGGIGEQTGSGSGSYKDWAGIYAYFFSILLYTTMYLTVVQKAFTLISYLPDKVLRWIGGSPESLGAESSQWGDEMVKGKSGEAAKATQDASGQMSKQLGGAAQKAAGSIGDKFAKGTEGTEVKARGNRGGGGEAAPSMPAK